MDSDKKQKARFGLGPEDMLRLRLYVVHGAPNSVRALANLNALCREYLPGRHRLEVVDFLKEPLRALEDGVLFSPTLARLSPPPVRTLVGSLDAKAQVPRFLGLEGPYEG